MHKLIDEGVFEMNKELEMPLVPKRISIISSPTAAGYQDFTNQLDLNSYGYKFEYKIFSAVVQGDKAEESMIEAFSRINMELEKWDIVALIRGGGSQTDLSCFDGYELANHIAQFPIPVITGIGHEKDTSIADMVAHTRLKTPTAAAEFIINQFVESESLLIRLKDHLTDLVHWIVNDQKLELSKIQNRLVPNVMKVSNVKNIELKELRHKTKELSRRFVTSLSHDLMLQKQLAKLVVNKRIEHEENHLNTINSLSKRGLQNTLTLANNKLMLLEKNFSSIKPENVLKRGFSITLFKGKGLKSVQHLTENDEIETVLSEGRVISWVKKIQKEEKF